MEIETSLWIWSFPIITVMMRKDSVLSTNMLLKAWHPICGRLVRTSLSKNLKSQQSPPGFWTFFSRSSVSYNTQVGIFCGRRSHYPPPRHCHNDYWHWRLSLTGLLCWGEGSSILRETQHSLLVFCDLLIKIRSFCSVLMMAQLITITLIATVLVVTWERYDLSGPHKVHISSAFPSPFVLPPNVAVPHTKVRHWIRPVQSNQIVEEALPTAHWTQK